MDGYFCWQKEPKHVPGKHSNSGLMHNIYAGKKKCMSLNKKRQWGLTSSLKFKPCPWDKQSGRSSWTERDSLIAWPHLRRQPRLAFFWTHCSSLNSWPTWMEWFAKKTLSHKPLSVSCDLAKQTFCFARSKTHPSCSRGLSPSSLGWCSDSSAT